eukprot:Gregarina_sp_Pseudo_9__803@NODE_1513_length_1534_cov_3_791304_g1401_i0_p4_GENE_NODE_1513_length_1534_cov_3_791304_g1401_i0NODE_1513_length_1534_cov_3_791304_g1401_i0_p4_ORF_typecomplete_len100_score0_18ABC_sub_bind/PF04392_12/0_093_NODE_1513_length_1534_cov_3_791304_g1401_i010051304
MKVCRRRAWLFGRSLAKVSPATLGRLAKSLVRLGPSPHTESSPSHTAIQVPFFAVSQPEASGVAAVSSSPGQHVTGKRQSALLGCMVLATSRLLVAGGC